MCIVTFIPGRESLYITSNRDEKLSRNIAAPPSLQLYAGKKIIFPSDGDAGGTWIAIKENGDVAVLLNGAFIKHLPKPPYRKSRGIILLDILAGDFPSDKFLKTSLKKIEPFTIIILENKLLYKFRWDGNKKYCKKLAPEKPYIWFSATLYDGLFMKNREKMFLSFLKENPVPTQLDIMNFHKMVGGNYLNNEQMKNQNETHNTVSITGILINDDKGVMKSIDLLNKKKSEINIRLSGIHTAV